MEWLLIGVAVIAGLLAWRIVASRPGAPRAGDPAPGFSLPDQEGRTRELGEFRGGWLVLYFYPRADTPGCTEQAARYAGAMREIEALGARICGVSVDGGDRLARFAAKYKLPFALLSDRDGVVAARYGSLVNLVLMKFAKRNTFLIDPRGSIAKVYLSANPVRNATEVLSDLKELNRK